jgi:dihydropteroate synthase
MIHIMGIVNLTPDSFYSGSRTQAADSLSRIRQMYAEGADVVDLGACSTRPGAPQPSLEEEWKRLEPVLRDVWHEIHSDPVDPRYDNNKSSLMPSDTPSVIPSEASVSHISIDTYRPEIVRRAYDIIGPFIVNDVGGGEPEMLHTVGELGLPYVAMHSRVPKGDVIEDVMDFFRDFAARADDAGVKDWILDPGFGFGKDIGQNYEILRRLEELQKAGREILIGISRKSMIYKVLGTTPEEVMPQTLALEMIALQKGATWLRVHDVKETAAMVKIYSTMYTSSPGAAK